MKADAAGAAGCGRPGSPDRRRTRARPGSRRARARRRRAAPTSAREPRQRCCARRLGLRCALLVGQRMVGVAARGAGSGGWYSVTPAPLASNERAAAGLGDQVVLVGGVRQGQHQLGGLGQAGACSSRRTTKATGRPCGADGSCGREFTQTPTPAAFTPISADHAGDGEHQGGGRPPSAAIRSSAWWPSV